MTISAFAGKYLLCCMWNSKGSGEPWCLSQKNHILPEIGKCPQIWLAHTFPTIFLYIQEPLHSLVQKEMVKLWLNHNCSPCDGDVRRAPSPIEQTHSIVSVSWVKHCVLKICYICSYDMLGSISFSKWNFDSKLFLWMHHLAGQDKKGVSLLISLLWIGMLMDDLPIVHQFSTCFSVTISRKKGKFTVILLRSPSTVRSPIVKSLLVIPNFYVGWHI